RAASRGKAANYSYRGNSEGGCACDAPARSRDSDRAACSSHRHCSSYLSTRNNIESGCCCAVKTHSSCACEVRAENIHCCSRRAACRSKSAKGRTDGDSEVGCACNSPARCNDTDWPCCSSLRHCSRYLSIGNNIESDCGCAIK